MTDIEVITQADHSEEVPLHHLETEQFLMAVQKAVHRLHWWVIGVNEHLIICQTLPDHHSQGDIISIDVAPGKAVLHSHPVNEYYRDENQQRNNIALLKRTIAVTAEEQDKANRSLHPMNREKYGALLPSKSYLVTPFIAYANALVFAAMVLCGISPLHPAVLSLLHWGGNLRFADTHGEWWRLFTYMFVHAGFTHLFMNAFALFYIGMFLEPLLGKFRFISAYLLSGMCAGLLSIIMHNNSVGVGASGAIFGMYGVFFSVLTTTHIQKTMKKTMLRSILFFIVFNLFSGLQGNTDNAAHIGGLLSGIIIGYTYYPGMAKHATFNKQLFTTIMLTAGTLVVAAITLSYLKAPY